MYDVTFQILAGSPIYYTPASDEKLESWRQRCIKDGTWHLSRIDFTNEQKQYIQRLIRTNRKLKRARNKLRGADSDRICDISAAWRCC